MPRKDDLMEAKEAQLSEQKQQPPFITSDHGVCFENDTDSLKAGVRGPVQIEDFHLREKITHFDHERIPERVVHARGSSARGYFELKESLSDVTQAAFLTDKSVRTPILVRYSQVLAGRNGPDMTRDIRGFAIRFYTSEGNYDLVGNNIPVFPIQDAMKFPDLIHSARPEPDTEMPSAGVTNHDNFWDFISLTPESMHAVMWMLSDRCIPRSLRMIQGFGVHTFVLLNAKGERSFVKFHLRPSTLGVHGICFDEALQVNGVDPDFHRRDLFDAIARGDFPEFDFGVQVVEESRENSFDFDLLDATKIIPEELVPVRWVGKLVLNKHVDPFGENEQVAFCPANLVPGIDTSNDPLLQGRLFSYLDTQINRFGTVNFTRLPVNCPVAPVVNNHRDGFMQGCIFRDKFNYSPNRGASIRVDAQRGCPTHPTPIQPGATKIRAKSEKFADHYSQAMLFFNSMTPIEQQHIIDAASFELGSCKESVVHLRMLDHFNHINRDLAVKVAAKLGCACPPALLDWTYSTQVSKHLSMLDPLGGTSAGSSVETRQVAVILADGFDAEQFLAVSQGLKSAKCVAKIVAPRKGKIESSKKTEDTAVEADSTFFTTKSVVFDGVIAIGGAPSVQTLAASGACLAFINQSFRHYKPIGAVDDALSLLLDVSSYGKVQLTGKESSSVCSDQGVVSSAHGASSEFVKVFLDALGMHRFWMRDISRIPA
ncbi:catalase HPII [Capsaspora owczarzaki ATCC 30864]|uniref:Catalase n=1 Tax=Capsaspora owczarzaki (strain ATCC 30864) TaxID=595528 RepID=A0A0D2X1W3_CAPO3|nr:catalase HPII [Capsaspora owczarzaki ATCC 30864]KJE91509.1 catalase HPII [Capsaspora owczarzaki ATCC 30864]|eukprot:XP_004349387.1 catalase HPII [Capsaspora owczarzaki ATCC 30864]